MGDLIIKAGAICIEDQKLLIVKPKKKPFWIQPGGKYEPGESTEACLRRELREEGNVELKSFTHYNNYNIDKAAHSDNPLRLELYFVRYAGIFVPSSEIEKMEWMSREDFESKKYNLSPIF